MASAHVVLGRLLEMPLVNQLLMRATPTSEEVDPQVLPVRPLSDQRQLLLAAMLVASSDDAIIEKDHQSVVTSWNPAAQRLYGYAAEEVVGRNISFLLPPDRLDELEAVLGRVAGGAGAQHYETKRVHKDGSLIDVAMTVSPIRDLSGTIVGTSTIQRNII